LSTTITDGRALAMFVECEIEGMGMIWNISV
jgi:hypothetical protein